jgi:hypothetical protein
MRLFPIVPEYAALKRKVREHESVRQRMGP